VSSNEKWNPSKDPFACSGCGTHLSESKRVAEDDYCDACQLDHGGVRADEA